MYSYPEMGLLIVMKIYYTFKSSDLLTNMVLASDLV